MGVYTFDAKFLLKPPSADTPGPDAACRPIPGELLIIQIAKLYQVVDDRGDNVQWKLPITQLPFDLDAAAGTDGKIPVGGVPCPLQFFVCKNRKGRSMLRPC